MLIFSTAFVGAGWQGRVAGQDAGVCSSSNRWGGSLHLGSISSVYGTEQQLFPFPLYGTEASCNCYRAAVRNAQSEEPYTNERRATLSAGMEPPMQSVGLNPPGKATFADDGELSAGDSAYQQHACAMLTVSSATLQLSPAVTVKLSQTDFWTVVYSHMARTVTS